MDIIFPTRGSKERYPKGKLIQGFGENKELYQQSIGMPGHNGWDIVPVQGYGEDIIAPHDGVIGYIAYQPNGYGNKLDLISLASNGKVLVSTLGHMTEQQIVKQGQQVKKGDVIGKMGNSGFVVSGGVPYWGQANPDKKGTHLHWTTKWMIPVKAGEPSNTSYLGQNYKIINFNNGFQGAFDPKELFEGAIMADQIITQAKGPERRIVLKCATEAQYKALCEVYGKDPSKIDETV